MVEPASDASVMQRIVEMFLHLTPMGLTVPYSICQDPEGNIWVATKEGLFKIDGQKRTLLWELKHPFPEVMAGVSHVVCHKDTIIYSCGEDDRMSMLRTLALDGEITYETFITGLFTSLVVSDEGVIYIIIEPQGSKSVISRTTVENIFEREVLVTSDDDEFRTLCVVDENTLMAAMSSRPVEMASEKRLVFIDIENRIIVKSISSAGKEYGQIFFPVAIRKNGEELVVLDKSGRFLRFSKEGTLLDVLAEIDANLASGFCIHHGAALVALSGEVLDNDRRTISDDWLEWINLDGSSWKKQREDARAVKTKEIKE